MDQFNRKIINAPKIQKTQMSGVCVAIQNKRVVKGMEALKNRLKIK